MSTLTCFHCYSKECEKTSEGAFDICQYGISYLKRNDRIEVKEPKVPLSTIAKNLRHEINPILQVIIEQTIKLDPNLSIKHIYPQNPLSVIIGSTVILDNFIQMITGVHEFHSTPAYLSGKMINLKSLINKYFVVYSILKEEGRTKSLQFNNIIPDNFFIAKCPDFIDYMIAMLIDNAWKYSINNSTLTININKKNNGKYTLKFVNKSLALPKNLNIFELGTKADELSKGFGYGLYWIKMLENSYNNIIDNDVDNQLKVTHKQVHENSEYSFQEFTIDNVEISKV